MLKQRFEDAITLAEFVEGAQVNQELWRAMTKRAQVPAELLSRLEPLPQPRYLLVLLEDWCGDAVNTVPVLDRLASEVVGLELRVLERDQNQDLMDAHLSGTSRSIPVVMVLDQEFREIGWWGSRPEALQTWVDSEEAQALSAQDRYREIRRWYARDHGRTTLAEVVALINRPANARAA